MVLALTLVAIGGMPKSLATKAFEADLILEYELTFDAEVMGAKEKGGASSVLPSGPLAAALSRAKVVRSLLGTLPQKAPPLGFVAGSTKKCLDAAAKKGRVRVLGFFKRGSQIYGIEQQLPTLTDLDPDYAKIVAAVEEAVKWRQPGATPAPGGDNRYVKELAAALKDPALRSEFDGPLTRECD